MPVCAQSIKEQPRVVLEGGGSDVRQLPSTAHHDRNGPAPSGSPSMVPRPRPASRQACLRVDGHGAKEAPLSRRVRPAYGVDGEPVGSSFQVAQRGENGRAVYALHASRVLHYHLDHELWSKSVYGPHEGGDDEEEHRLRAAEASPSLVQSRPCQLLARRPSDD